MNVIAFLVSFVLFVGGMYLFGVAFQVAEGVQGIVFFGGIIAIAVSIMLPVHVLKRIEG